MTIQPGTTIHESGPPVLMHDRVSRRSLGHVRRLAFRRGTDHTFGLTSDIELVTAVLRELPCQTRTSSDELKNSVAVSTRKSNGNTPPSQTDNRNDRGLEPPEVERRE